VEVYQPDAGAMKGWKPAVPNAYGGGHGL
jgi:hypothetical protein